MFLCRRFHTLPLLVLCLLASLGVPIYSAQSAQLFATLPSQLQNSVHITSRKKTLSNGHAVGHGMRYGVSEVSIRTKYDGFQSASRLTQPDEQSSWNSLSEITSAQSTSGNNCTVSFKGENVSFSVCSVDPNREIDVYFNITADSIDTLFRAPRVNGTYVGLGWGCSQMIDCNAVVASGPTEAIHNYNLTRYGLSESDRNDKVVSNTDIEVSNDYIAARFTRPLMSDMEGVPELSGDTYKFIWALGNLDSSGMIEKHSTKGTSSVDTKSGAVSSISASSSLYRAHAILMGVSWLVFAPLAVLAMRFFKKYNPITFRIHMGLAVTVLTCTLIAVLVVVFKASHTEKEHMGVGYTVLVLVALQVAAGFLRPGKTASIRSTWYIIHMTSGLVTTTLAFINIVIGIGVIQGGRGWYALVALVFIAEIAMFVIFSILKRKFPTVQTERKPTRSYTPSDPADDSQII